jgi:hypothetical protein
MHTQALLYPDIVYALPGTALFPMPLSEQAQGSLLLELPVAFGSHFVLPERLLTL